VNSRPVDLSNLNTTRFAQALNLVSSIWKSVESLDKNEFERKVNQFYEKYYDNSILTNYLKLQISFIKLDLEFQRSQFNTISEILNEIDIIRVNDNLIDFGYTEILKQLMQIELLVNLGSKTNIDITIKNLEGEIKRLPEDNVAKIPLIFPYNNKNYLFVRYYNMAGYYHQKLGKMIKAEHHYKKAYGMLKHNEYGVINSKTIMNLGVISWYHGKIDEASKLYNSINKLEPHLKNILLSAKVKNNIALIAEYQGNFNSALDLYYSTLPVFQVQHDLHSSAITLNNIANIYSKQVNYERALQNYQLSMEALKQIGSKSVLIHVYNNLAKLYRLQNEYDKSVHYLNLAYYMQEELQEYNVCHLIYYNYIKLYLSQNNIDKAKEFYTRMVDLLGKNAEITSLQRYWLIYSRTIIDLAINTNGSRRKLYVELENITKHNKIDKFLQMLIYIALIDLDVFEIKINPNIDENSQLNKIDKYIQEIQNFSEIQKTFEVSVETLILRSKLSLFKHEYSQAIGFINSAQELAESIGSNYLVKRSQYELNEINNNISDLFEALQNNLGLYDKIEKLHFQNYVQIVKDVIDRS
jgi:tetratricopeptide (TPR) repeat protein